jgi:molybdate/tungstate transport system ATP-binding protein
LGAGVAVEKLSNSWPNFSLRNINLAVSEGSYFVLLGPTGSGKTLLLEAIAGAYSPAEGRIIVGGEDVSHLPPEKRRISYAPQNYLLFENMTVRRNIEYGLHAKGIEEQERRRRSKHLLQTLGISHLVDRFPKNLSGGERQRVSLARALAVEPRAVLLDEPLSAVDAETKNTIIDHLRRVHTETGVTVIHVTHDRFEAAALADRIGIISGGEIREVGSPLEFSQKPYSKLDNIFGADNLISGNVIGRDAELALVDVGAGKTIEALTDRTGRVMLHVRPENIVISKHGVESSARNRFEGTIAEVTDLGATIRIQISGKIPLTAIITRRSFFEMGLNIGSPVNAFFKATLVDVL